MLSLLAWSLWSVFLSFWSLDGSDHWSLIMLWTGTDDPDLKVLTLVSCLPLNKELSTFVCNSCAWLCGQWTCAAKVIVMIVKLILRHVNKTDKKNSETNLIISRKKILTPVTASTSWLSLQIIIYESSTIRHPHLYISRSQLGHTTIIIITSSNLVITRQLLCLQPLDISWPLESWWRSRGGRRRTSSPSPSMCRTRLPHKSHTWNSMEYETWKKKTENVPNIWLFTLMLFYWYPQLIFDEINLVATLYI